MSKKYIDADVLKQKMHDRGWTHPDETVKEFVEDDLPAAETKTVRYWHEDVKRPGKPHKVIEVE